MKYYLNLDAGGYLLSVSTAPMDAPSIESLDGLDLSGSRINAYRWDGESLVLDGARLAELEAQEAAEAVRERVFELTARLRASDSVVLEALEGLLTATTATGFIAALISAAKSIRATLAERTSLREQIRELEK